MVVTNCAEGSGLREWKGWASVDIIDREQGHRQQQRPPTQSSGMCTESSNSGIPEDNHGHPGATFNISKELEGKCSFSFRERHGLSEMSGCFGQKLHQLTLTILVNSG